MTPRASTTCWTLACVTLLAACNGASIPNPLSSGGGSDVQVKEITNLSPRASVVLDKNCPDLVQPYRLADNVASMTMFSVKEGLKGVSSQLTSMLSGKSAAPTTGGSLSDSTKLAAKQLNWMPMTAEEMYAERQHNKRTDLLSRTSKLGKKYYPTADKMLADILASINEPYDYRFKLFIVKTDNRNALALPGGYLYLDQGLLDTPEHQRKAYFALAHEIGHVLQRHETKEMQSLVVDSFTVKEELVDTIQSAKNNPGAVVDRIKLEKGQFTQHHVDQELQADSCAVKMLSHVYPDNQQLAATIDTFVKDLPQVRPAASSGSAGGSVQAVSEEVYDIVNSPMMRHPNTRERTDNLQAIYREVTSTTTAAQ